MNASKISFDLDLSNSIYKSNNNALIEVSNRNLEHFKQEFENYIQALLEDRRQKFEEAASLNLSDIMNIEWILLNSIYISLFANFENHISELASIVEDRSTSQVRVQDIKGQGYIDQYRQYIHLIGKIKCAERNPTWGEIDIFRITRNKLVHNHGYFNPNPKNDLTKQPGYEFLIKNKVLLAGPLGHIRIREIYFLEKFVLLVNNLSDQIKQEINNLYK